ncbi:anti-adapter protein IraP [Brenneria tiliae]|uniref:Anti-adapter protein IraP n=1 Tax=Brenneria tiliae TaxID=2914984 RepID=A0ABT0MTJ7_9GAMM|nr:anti-adapter protein IraP [Brenneria tiliae]MCL2892519.1 anti-adapter protein IraP [Brenneria tiliae]
MKNVIISMVTKISKMDAEAKLLAARVEAQSLLIGALLLTIGKNGGVNEMVDNVKKAINAALDSADNPLKSDAEILLNEFNTLLSLTQLLEENDSEIDYESLNARPGQTATD